jgi:hypothetical protein
MANNDDFDVDEQPEPQPPQKQEKLYSKAEIDAMLAKQQVRIRKEFSDYASLQVAAQELEQLKSASKSSEERLRDEATKAARERDAALDRYNESRIRVAIMAEAARQNVRDPEDVVRMLDRNELVITDDGIDGVKEAVELLLASKRYLVRGRNSAGTELRGPERSSGTQLTRSQIREWMRGNDGGITPEREKQIREAQAAGQIDLSR